MSLVLNSLHPSSLELRYLVPPCPGRSLVFVVCNERECVWCDRRALVARLCVLPLSVAPPCGAGRRLLARAFRRLLNNGRVSKGPHAAAREYPSIFLSRGQKRVHLGRF